MLNERYWHRSPSITSGKVLREGCTKLFSWVDGIKWFPSGVERGCGRCSGCWLGVISPGALVKGRVALQDSHVSHSADEVTVCPMDGTERQCPGGKQG